MIVARCGWFLNDLADDIETRASMLNSTSDIECGFLQRTVNAPGGRVARTFAVVSTIPRGFSGKDAAPRTIFWSKPLGLSS